MIPPSEKQLFLGFLDIFPATLSITTPQKDIKEKGSKGHGPAACLHPTAPL